MRIPSEIHYNGMRYKIETEPSMDDGTQLILGELDEDEQTIRLSEHQTSQAQQRTLLHELVHMILAEADVAGKGYGKRVPEDEEVLCEIMSHGLYMLMVDNPGLFESAKKT